MAKGNEEPAAKDATKSAPVSSPFADDIFSEKLDLCFTDTLIKTGAGGLIGGVTSALFLKMRRWPIIAGMGIGVGLAWANCEHELNSQIKTQS